ncbi:MAG: VCBS repeat-containing protein [Parcubacteria group bacterium]|nr:VCBS repeat-containing protein [Parcubacteria group bacterium]
MKKFLVLTAFVFLGAFLFAGSVQAAILTAAREGGGPHVRFFDADGEYTEKNFFAFAEDFQGGVNLAVGDVDRDGYEEIVVAAGSSGGPQVRIFSQEGEPKYPGFFAWEQNFHGGITLAVGDIDGDKQEEIIVGPASGKESEIKIFDYLGNEVADSFVAFGANFTGGVSLAAGDVDYDRQDEIIVGAGQGGGPQVRIFDSDGTVKPFQFFAFSEEYHGGVNVAAGDFDLDGKDEIGVCQAEEQAWCKIYRYNVNKVVLAEWKAYGDFTVGADISLADVDEDGMAEIITAAGAGGSPHVQVFELSGEEPERISSFYSYDQKFRGGVNVEYINENRRDHNFIKGLSYAGYYDEVFLEDASDASLEALAKTGTEWVAVVPVWYQETKNSNEIFRYYTPTDESVRHVIDKIHSLGMKVLLKPFVDSQDGTWRALFEPSDWDAWFTSYRSFINLYAQIAEEKDVEMLSLGVEYNSSEGRLADWRAVIDSAEEYYSGPLTYAANHSAVEGYGGGYQNIGFWNELDYVGIDTYFVLTDKNDPSLAELEAAWRGHLSEIETWRNGSRLNKPVIFTEVGYGSYDGSNKTPWSYDFTDKVADWSEQADCYEALITESEKKSWFAGLFFWWWDNPSTDDYYRGGENYNLGFTPRGKNAEDVLKEYFWFRL